MKQEIVLTIDAVIFAEENKVFHLLMIKRKNDPFKNKWALPGGFLEEDEKLEKGCLRELEEETGLQLKKLQHVGIYDEVNRDPRGRTISVAFTKIIPKKLEVMGNDDAAEAKWIEVNQLNDLAFDHFKIIQDAIKKLQISL
jgi:8-oxo-dGTP diphosphatase